MRPYPVRVTGRGGGPEYEKADSAAVRTRSGRWQFPVCPSTDRHRALLTKPRINRQLKYGFPDRHYLGRKFAEIPSGIVRPKCDVDLADLQRVLVSRRRDDVVHAKVGDELSVVVSDVPYGGDCYCKASVVSPVLTPHLFFCAVVRHCRQDLVAVIEGITQILDELRFRRSAHGATFFAVFGRSFLLDLVEEREITARDVFDLLGKGTNSLESRPGGNKAVKLFGHRFCGREELGFSHLQHKFYAIG